MPPPAPLSVSHIWFHLILSISTTSFEHETNINAPFPPFPIRHYDYHLPPLFFLFFFALGISTAPIVSFDLFIDSASALITTHSFFRRKPTPRKETPSSLSPSTDFSLPASVERPEAPSLSSTSLFFASRKLGLIVGPLPVSALSVSHQQRL